MAVARVGRPTKLTPRTRAVLLDAIESGATFVLAAHAASITYETFNEWRKQYPYFSEAVENAVANSALFHLRNIKEHAADDWRASSWILEHRFPDEYGSKARVQVDGQITIKAVIEARTAVITALADYPDAQLAVAQALAQLDAGDAEKVAE